MQTFYFARMGVYSGINHIHRIAQRIEAINPSSLAAFQTWESKYFRILKRGRFFRACALILLNMVVVERLDGFCSSSCCFQPTGFFKKLNLSTNESAPSICSCQITQSVNNLVASYRSRICTPGSIFVSLQDSGFSWAFQTWDCLFWNSLNSDLTCSFHTREASRYEIRLSVFRIRSNWCTYRLAFNVYVGMIFVNWRRIHFQRSNQQLTPLP